METEKTAQKIDYTPRQLIAKDWQEVVAVREVREGWGLEDDERPEDFAKMVYAVKFNFASGNPGYVGDLYILQGDSLEAPLRLKRNKNRQLEVIE